jgi:hypothetical protein
MRTLLAQFFRWLGLYLLLLVISGPFMMPRLCADRPIDGKYCSFEKTWTYLAAGGDAWLWIYLVVMAFMTVGLLKERIPELDP